MGCITYIAVDRGNLVAGHSAGTEYHIDIDFERYDPSYSKKASNTTSIGGRRFVRYHRTEKRGDFSTIWVDDVNLHAQFIEFMDSVYGGQEFIVDPYGTYLSPVEPMDATIVGDINVTRYKRMERWKYSFGAYL